MARLITLQGPEVGRQFTLDERPAVLGRHLDCTICLDSKAVSRQHARLTWEDGTYFVEDLGSSNGTFVNGQRVLGKVPLADADQVQVGPYLFGLRLPDTPAPAEEDLVIREQVSAAASNHTLLAHEPAQKLQAVLEISQVLARTLDIGPLLDKLLGKLLHLFPQSDRALVLLYEGDRLVVRGHRSRRPEDGSSFPYSRTIVKRALDEGVGILSEDVRSDRRFQASQTLTALEVRSLLCVPLIAPDDKRLGVIQVERFRAGIPFRREDLQLLTAVGLQAAVVLENAALHAELLREERLRQELAMAREIQQSFLPDDFGRFKDQGFELFARVHPARQVSGDLYDFVSLADGRLAFFVGDVSGKGVPSALFMIAVRTLIRHLALGAASPAETLARLNAALTADNPAGMFVTLVHGLYRPDTGEVVLASGGHPAPLLRRPQGQTEEIPVPPGRLLGFEEGDLRLRDHRFVLAPGDLLVCYTDGFPEAREPAQHTLFGLERFRPVVQGFGTGLPLAECAAKAREAVEQFISSSDLQDDLTLLLLRRTPPGSERGATSPEDTP